MVILGVLDLWGKGSFRRGWPEGPGVVANLDTTHAAYGGTPFHGRGLKTFVHMGKLAKLEAVMRKFSAEWIYRKDNAKDSNVYTYFRKEFTVSPSDILTKTALYITAQTFFRVYINGALAGQGPVPSPPYHKYYETYDITPHITPGANCIGVVVYYAQAHKDTPGGLLCEIENGGKLLAKTGPDWAYLPADCWHANTYMFDMNHYFPYQEFYRAEAFIDYFAKVSGASDSGTGPWQPARIISQGRGFAQSHTPFVKLVPRNIPPMETDILTPAAITQTGETIALENRKRASDLSIVLSMPGAPLHNAIVEGNLPAIHMQSSPLPVNHNSDGFYNPYIVLDLGRIITGHLAFELEAAAGQILEFGYAEQLINGTFNNMIEGQFADRYVTKAGPQSYRFWSWRGFRYLKILARNAFAGVKFRDIRVHTSTYPFKENESSFSSPQPGLNALFDACKYTVRLCANEFYMDTPWREQAQWTGDTSAVTIPAAYACFGGDTALARKYLEETAASQYPTGFLPNITNQLSSDWTVTFVDYTFWWVISLWQYYMHTGDAELVNRLYPHAVKVLQATETYLDADGMINDIPYKVFIDWAPVQRTGKCAALNGIYYAMVQCIGKMAAFKNDAYVLTLANDIEKRIAANFEAVFYDPAAGCIRDARVDGALTTHISEHANALALLHGLVSGEAAAAIIETIFRSNGSTHITEAQPFFATFSIKALLKYDEPALAYTIIQKWLDRMIARGATTTYEEWDRYGSRRYGDFNGIMRSQSHAWSAYPAEYMLRDLVGFEILTPGCGKLRFKLHNTGFDFDAKFTIPQGPVTVCCKGGKATISVPGGVEALYTDNIIVLESK